MRKVFKYQLENSTSVLSLSKTAIIRKVALQYGHPTVWAEVEDTEEKRLYEVRSFCTGEALPKDIDTYSFLDTVLCSGGDIVLHFYGKWLNQ